MQWHTRWKKLIDAPTLTDWLLMLFTAALTVVGCMQWHEMHTGGSDTHNLAIAAVAANRAWVAPNQAALEGSITSFPIPYQIHIVNFGKEPALGVRWKFHTFGIPYISDTDEDYKVAVMPENRTCDGLMPANQGTVIYPQGGNVWVPMRITDTEEDRQTISGMVNQTRTLVLEGCFAYVAAGQRHTSSFRFFLRDIPGTPSFVADQPGRPSSAWDFNVSLTGNDAN